MGESAARKYRKREDAGLMLGKRIYRTTEISLTSQKSRSGKLGLLRPLGRIVGLPEAKARLTHYSENGVIALSPGEA